MKKQVVILTASDKKNGYCVAGVDFETGQWIRLEDKQNSEHGCAIKPEDFVYPDGKKCEILDLVQVELTGKNDDPELPYQVENYFMDMDQGFQKLGELTWKQLFGLFPSLLIRKEDILNTGYKKNDGYRYPIGNRTISLESVRKLDIEKTCSLQLVEISDYSVFKFKEEDHHMAIRFKYTTSSGNKLIYTFTLTDPDEQDEVPKERGNHAFMIVSLSMPFQSEEDEESGCYLLGAKLIKDPEIKFPVIRSARTGIRFYHPYSECTWLRKKGITIEEHSLSDISSGDFRICKECEQKLHALLK